MLKRVSLTLFLLGGCALCLTLVVTNHSATNAAVADPQGGNPSVLAQTMP